MAGNIAKGMPRVATKYIRIIDWLAIAFGCDGGTGGKYFPYNANRFCK
jgi:hypothetical protein